MTNNVKALEELKGIVMDLHRSAGDLDGIIRRIEYEWESMTHIEREFFLRNMLEYRLDLKQHAGYSGLEAKEGRIWNELLNSAKEERP